MTCPVLLMPENDHERVQQNYVCLVVKETDWVVSFHNTYKHFRNNAQWAVWAYDVVRGAHICNVVKFRSFVAISAKV